MEKISKYNIFDEPIEVCSLNPLTGFFRDGCCKSNQQDHGSHLVCAQVTNQFLDFSLSKGNDLITPRKEFHFKGLKHGDRWCLCSDRWIEALKANVAPKIILKATNKEILKKIDLKILMKHSLDVN